MPEMIPVGNTIIPPDPMRSINTISGILGIKQQQQALQTGQYQQQTAQAGAIQAQQGAKELQSGTKLLSDPVGNGLIDEDGNPTKDSYRIIKSVMPTTGDERYQDLLKTAQGHVEFRNAVQNLSQNEQSYVSSRLAGIVADPNAHISDVVNGINDLKAQFKGTAEESSVNRLVNVIKSATDDAGDKHGMDGVRKVLNGFSRGAIGNVGITGPAGITMPNQATMQGPNGLQVVNTNPYAPQGIGPMGQPFQQGLAPTQQPSYIRQTAAAGAEGGQGASNDETLYNNITQEGTKATQIKSLSQDIQRMAGEVQTGEYSKAFANKWAAVAQTLGVSPENLTDTTRRQILSKMTNQLKLQSEAGATTDTERAGVESAMPDPEHMTPQAVQQAARYVGAQADVKSSRMDLANKHRQIMGGTSTGLRGIDSQFMQNADPRLFEYQNIPSGKERQEYLAHHFSTAAEIQAFLQKKESLKAYGAMQ